MKWRKTSMIVGIDHGYGYTKTRHSVLASGVATLESAPPLMTNVVKFNDIYYQVGVEPDGLAEDKTSNIDYYILTLSAIAEEMKNFHILSADITMAVGLPLTRYGTEKEAFLEYLNQYASVDFEYEEKTYHININPNIYIYPQGYAAVAPKIASIKGTCYLVDIGTGTTEILPISGDHKIDLKRAKTIQHGVSDLFARVNAAVSEVFHGEMSRDQIIDILLCRECVIPEKVKNLCLKQIAAWCSDTIKILRQNKVNYDITQTFIMGGGAGVLKKFSTELSDTCITFIEDIQANATGYEILARATEQHKR
jgi:plasmid segregation protein ParM